MRKNEPFESLWTKNKFFNIHERKSNFIQSLRTKTIVYPKFND